MLNAQQDVRAAGQEEVVAFLSRSETFGGQAVEIVETHASIIFLAGDRAFKLKRAVRYSFLDYSTPERRRDACLAELSINRRFAPDLYLEVQPVVRRPDGLLGFGNGASVPVDWLVVMRHFDAAAQLDRMAEKGELRPELARPLAERIADLHARAEARFNHGGAAGLARAIDITAGNLQSHASEIGADAVWRWTRRARAALRAHAALLDRRIGRARQARCAPAMATCTFGTSACSMAGRRRSTRSSSTPTWPASTCSTILPSCS